jgi:hypothetical protein
MDTYACQPQWGFGQRRVMLIPEEDHRCSRYGSIVMSLLHHSDNVRFNSSSHSDEHAPWVAEIKETAKTPINVSLTVEKKVLRPSETVYQQFHAERVVINKNETTFRDILDFICTSRVGKTHHHLRLGRGAAQKNGSRWSIHRREGTADCFMLTTT